jgi:hypothetical protein
MERRKAVEITQRPESFGYNTNDLILRASSF